MSGTKQILELRSPATKTRHEHLMASAQQCNYCKGSGKFWTFDGHNMPIWDDCPICGGSGEVKADITIEWKANKKV